MYKAIDESLPVSEKLASLSHWHFRVWLQGLTKADHFGRMTRQPRKFIALSMPLVQHIDEAMVETALDVLMKVGLVHGYRVGEKKYMVFHEHERYNRTQKNLRHSRPKYPEPPTDGMCQCIRYATTVGTVGAPVVPTTPFSSVQVRSGQDQIRANGVPAELKGLELYEMDLKLCKRWPKLLPAWTQSFPGVDIVAETMKAHAWEVANPTKRKKDRPRFLHNWFSRQQDKPRPGTKEPWVPPEQRGK